MGVYDARRLKKVGVLHLLEISGNQNEDFEFSVVTITRVVTFEVALH